MGFYKRVGNWLNRVLDRLNRLTGNDSRHIHGIDDNRCFYYHSGNSEKAFRLRLIPFEWPELMLNVGDGDYHINFSLCVPFIIKIYLGIRFEKIPKFAARLSNVYSYSYTVSWEISLYKNLFRFYWRAGIHCSSEGFQIDKFILPAKYERTVDKASFAVTLINYNTNEVVGIHSRYTEVERRWCGIKTATYKKYTIESEREGFYLTLEDVEGDEICDLAAATSREDVQNKCKRQGFGLIGICAR